MLRSAGRVGGGRGDGPDGDRCRPARLRPAPDAGRCGTGASARTTIGSPDSAELGDQVVPGPPVRRHVDTRRRVERAGVADLVRQQERQHGAVGAGARRTARAVQVVLVVVRRVVVHDEVDVVDVDAAGGDVGGYQDPRLTAREGVERPLALRLAQVAVDGARRAYPPW